MKRQRRKEMTTTTRQKVVFTQRISLERAWDPRVLSGRALQARTGNMVDFPEAFGAFRITTDDLFKVSRNSYLCFHAGTGTLL